jgi:hypothetical protein
LEKSHREPAAAAMSITAKMMFFIVFPPQNGCKDQCTGSLGAFQYQLQRIAP